MVRVVNLVRAGLCGLSLCAIGVAVGSASAMAAEWPEVELASCCEESLEPYCGDACNCGSACSSASDCGYCFTFPMCDEFTAKLTPLMMEMAQSGFIYSPSLTQFYQGVADGGEDRGFEYGGKVDQFFILDSGKLGMWQGMTMTMHVETRFGEDVNREAVGFAPVNVAMLYPNLGEHDTAITGLSFAQFIDDDVQAVFGKFNGLDLFYSMYPQTGRGVNGFMNASMLIPLSVGRVVPLSFMGAGVQKLHGKQVEGALLVYDTQDCATTSGFDDLFGNGANIMASWRFFTEMGGLPGSHGFNGIWSTGEFVAYDPTGFVIVPDDGIVAVPQGGAYTLFYVFEQQLWADHCQPARNVGLLSQWGIADEATSPVGWSANVAIQATGLSGARPHDAIGVGYFHTAVSDDLQNLLSPVRTLQDVDGVEVYYSAAVAKGLTLTSDLQVIEPADVANDTAVVVGLRLSAGL